MAVVKPVFWDSATGNIKIMSSDQMQLIHKQVAYLFDNNPSTTLTTSASNVSNYIGIIYDTRRIAGITTSSATSYPNPPNTTIQTDTYRRVTQVTTTPSEPLEDFYFTYPFYWDGSNLRKMTAQDFKDTFIYPYLALANAAPPNDDQEFRGGMYRALASSSSSPATIEGSTAHTNAFFKDTRANTSLFNTTDETQDQPYTEQWFHIYKYNGVRQDIVLPLSLFRSNNTNRTMTRSSFDSLLEQHVRYSAINDVGYRLTYVLDTSGSDPGFDTTIQFGSDIVDTRYDSQTRRTKFVNANNYRAQDVPTSTTLNDNVNTYRLYHGRT